MLETSALKFVPRIFYSKEKVAEIVERNSVSDDTDETDVSLIEVAKPTPTPDPQAEVKATPELSVRAGFNLATTGQRNFIDYYLDNSGHVQVDLTPLTSSEKWAQAKMSASLGFGYTFDHFFLDATVRARFLPKEYIIPYFYYTYDNDYTDKYVDDSIEVPEFEVRSTIFDALLTFGWRF